MEENIAEEYKKLMEKAPDQTNFNNGIGQYGTCPNCGYCPHCGRGGHRNYPTNPWSPWYVGTPMQHLSSGGTC